MDITINTPALLFPAISLIMLAHTNRFLALASRVRSLHANYEKGEKQAVIHSQIRNLKYRLRLIKNMQALGILSFLVCIFCMYCIYIEAMQWANVLFAVSLLLFISSLVLSLIEVQLSTKALELQLSDMEGLEDPSLVNYLKSKFERE
jgi:DMSO reductase anchor subunit